MLPRTPADEVRRFARRWAAALRGSMSPTMTQAEVRALLAGLTVKMVDAVRANTNLDALGHEVGALLVDANYRDPAVLDNTVRMLGTTFATAVSEFLDDCPDRPALGERIAILQGGLARGFTSALRQRVLDEQEATQRAALEAARHAEEHRRASDARFQAVFVGAAVGIGTVGLDGIVLDVNDAMADMLGVPPNRIRGRTIAEVIGPENLGPAYTHYLDLINGVVNRFRLETSHTRPDGRTGHLDLSMSLVRSGDGTPEFLIGVAVDLTERRLLQDRLWHEARHDALTGLPNRTLFFERVATAEQPIGMCYIDLDGFKNVNDSRGHEAGDRLLVAIARRLSNAIEDQNSLVARLGGDEFVALVEGCTVERICDKAERVVAELSRPIRLDGDELVVTGSVGVVHSTVIGTDPGQLMRAADVALYQAKGNGTGRWELYDPTRGAAEVARRTLATELPSALARNEFYLEYQPLVRLADSALLGFEALARWTSSRLGPLSPGQFIPVAEETGHIVALGQWVLAAACRQARAWHDQYPDQPFYVSVNVSATQLAKPDFTADVLRTLEDTGLPANRLQLELTETAVAGEAHSQLTALQELAAAGVRLAIDDFGTGYSNLAQLGRLPVHQLKIDRSLIRPDAPTDLDPAQDKIVAATITLAHLLDLDVIAEGVETAAQADRLRTLHCDGVQGWLYGAATSAGTATRIIAGQHFNPDEVADPLRANG